MNSNIKRLLVLAIVFLIPSPYEFFNFPLDNLTTVLFFIGTYIVLINIRIAGLILLPLLLIFKIGSFTNLDNSYKVCISSYTEEVSKCENTFTQYTFLKNNYSYKTLDINYGTKLDDKTFHGHSDSNWKTNYLTGLNGKAKTGSTHYKWLPFSAKIEKKFTSNKDIEISYFGDLKIYADTKLIFAKTNYKNIETIKISTRNSNYKFLYEYNHPEKQKFILQETSAFNTIEKQHFATLKINENDSHIEYILYVFITIIFLTKVIYLNFIKFSKKKELLYVLFLLTFNLFIYVLINSQTIISVIISSVLVIFRYFNKNFLFRTMLIISPFQILKLFDESFYSMPRIPGTVPQHHQAHSLGMNEIISFSNYFRGGDNVFYEPPLFRYILHALNILYGSRWYFVCLIYLYFIIFLLSRNIPTPDNLISFVVLFFVFNMFFSSGFLNLLLYGWSEPFFILILLFLVDAIRTKRKINASVTFLLISLILIRPESILYLSVFAFLIYKNFGIKNKKSLLPIVGLFLPLIHNLYFGNEFLLFSSTGNELGYFDFLSKDGSIPIEQSLSKMSTSKIFGIFFIPFDSLSLNYVGRGFLIINLLIFLTTIMLCFKYKFMIYNLIIIIFSFSPYLIYDIFDGYPRRALALTTSCILVNCCLKILNYSKGNTYSRLT
tara:strand:- start:8051 stop:10042 length:1992 start_codon:yes stop_codon:yes gene_type:complete